MERGSTRISGFTGQSETAPDYPQKTIHQRHPRSMAFLSMK
jgi:hypothetical protein